MKRFAILTEINDCNYGAQLQGFALAAILRTLGAEVEQLNFWYRPYNKALWGTLAKRKTLSGQIFQFLMRRHGSREVYVRKAFLNLIFHLAYIRITHTKILSLFLKIFMTVSL